MLNKRPKSLNALFIGAGVVAFVVITFIVRVQQLDKSNEKRQRRQQRLYYDYDAEGFTNKLHFTIEYDSTLRDAFKNQLMLDKSEKQRQVRWIKVDETSSNVTQSHLPLQYLSFAMHDVDVPRIRMFYIGNMLEEPVFCWMVSFLENNLLQFAVSVVRRAEFYRGDRRFVDGVFVESGVADCWPTYESTRSSYIKLSFSRWPARAYSSPKRALLRAVERGEFVRIFYPEPRNATKWHPQQNQSAQARSPVSENRLLVVHKMLHGAVPYYDVIEWFEWLRLFSVDSVCVAKYHDLATVTRRVLDHYELRLRLAVTWSVGRLRGVSLSATSDGSAVADGDPEQFDYSRFERSRRLATYLSTDDDEEDVDALLSDRDKSIVMQGASLNLCAWTSGNLFGYVAVFDLDELLLPSLDASYSAMLSRITTGQHTTYIISNLHFLKELQDVRTAVQGNQSAEAYPRSLGRTVRAGNTDHAWKSISRLPDCRLLHCHVCIEPEDYARRTRVNSSLVALHHYSYCHSFQTDVCKQLKDERKAVLDDSALRFAKVLRKRIHSTANAINISMPTHYPTAALGRSKPGAPCCL